MFYSGRNAFSWSLPYFVSFQRNTFQGRGVFKGGLVPDCVMKKKHHGFFSGKSTGNTEIRPYISIAVTSGAIACYKLGREVSGGLQRK